MANLAILHNYDYIYLHGFASSPDSGKAQFYKNKFMESDIAIHIPDLNDGDFKSLTLTRQLNQVQQIIESCSKPIVLIGSSMGGLTSYILAETNTRVIKIISLAPAFRMSKLWVDSITDEQLNNWQTDGYQNIFHYAYNKDVQLNYRFYTDLFVHDDHNFKRHIPNLIFHGRNDTVVPIGLSEQYKQINPNTTLVNLDDDHSVNKYLDHMWNLSVEFICK